MEKPMELYSTKEIITKWQLFCILTLIITSERIVLTGYKLEDNGAWVSMIIGAIFAAVISLIYIFIIYKNKEQNVFDLFHSLFGKWIGILLSIIFIAFCLLIAVVSTKNMALQIRHINFKDSPFFYINIFFVLLYVFILYKGIEVSARLGSLLLFIITILTIIITILLIPDFEPFNMMPLVAVSFKEILIGAYHDYFIIYGDGVILLGLIISSKGKNNKKNKFLRVFLITYLISCIFNLISIIYPILVLGFSLYNKLYYPGFYALSIIDIAMFITRIEVLISTFYMTTIILKSVIALYVATKGLQKIFSSKSNRTYIIPVCIITYIGSLILFNNADELILFYNEIGIYKGIVQVVIPVILAIFLLFRKKTTITNNL